MAIGLFKCPACGQRFLSQSLQDGHDCQEPKPRGRQARGYDPLRYEVVAARCAEAVAAGEIASLAELRASESERGTDPRLVEIAIRTLAHRDGITLV